MLGSIANVDVLRTYCSQWRNDAFVVGPGQPGNSPTWACVDPHAKRPSDATLQAAPNYVCRWKYRDNSSYSPAQGSDKLERHPPRRTYQLRCYSAFAAFVSAPSGSTLG